MNFTIYFILSWWIADDILAPSTEYYDEIATVTQFLSEMCLQGFFFVLFSFVSGV